MKPEPQLDIVLFRAGPWVLGVEARHVAASHSGTGSQAPTAEQLLRLPTPPSTANHPSGQHPTRQQLTLQTRTRKAPLLVSSPVELLRANASALYPLPPLLAARQQLPGLRALLSLAPQQYALLFDPEQWDWPENGHPNGHQNPL